METLRSSLADYRNNANRVGGNLDRLNGVLVVGNNGRNTNLGGNAVAG